VAPEPESNQAGELDEARLVHLAQNGDIGAFEELVIEYENGIYNLAYRMLGSPEDARDISQEVFLRAYRSLRSFREEASFSTWVYRIAKNACLDELRKRSKVQAVSVDQPLETEEGAVQRELPSKLGDPERAVEQVELSELIEQALGTLADQYRSAVVLRDLHGFAYEEIAEIMEVSLGTVKSRIHRGRQALKEVLLESELFSHADVETSERRQAT